MAKYELFQARKTNYGLGPHPLWPESFRLVAAVEAEDLEEVFFLTNSDLQHPEVCWLVGDWRSTSVGDVVVGPDGRAHRCEMIAWSDIPPAETK
jgi:hypothetical protein